MNGKITAWPFLVSRNSKLGYRPVVVPEFLSRRALSYLLYEATANSSANAESTVLNHVEYREIHGVRGAISLFFRVVKARDQFAGPKENDAFLDPFGRPIELTEGIVLSGQHPEMIVTRKDLQKAFSQVEQAYIERFWKNNDLLFKEIPSEAFFLAERASTNHIALIAMPSLETEESLEFSEQDQQPEPPPPPPPPPPQTWQKWVIASVVVLLLGVVAWGIYLYAKPGSANTQNQPTAAITITTPEQTLAKFCDALQHTNYQEAYNQLSSQAQQSITEQDFASFFSAPDHQVVSCTFSSPRGSGNRQTSTLTLTYKDKPSPDTVTIALTRATTNSWKIDENIVQELKNLQPTPIPTPTSTPTPTLTPTPTPAPQESLRT